MLFKKVKLKSVIITFLGKYIRMFNTRSASPNKIKRFLYEAINRWVIDVQKWSEQGCQYNPPSSHLLLISGSCVIRDSQKEAMQVREAQKHVG